MKINIPVADELPPERTVNHKSHIAKVVFLCAQARPRQLPNNQWWDGKIGIWPVGCCRAAKRDSCNGPKGTGLFESEFVDVDEFRDMLTGLVLPAILNEFRTAECNRFDEIIIQQDSAPAHMCPRDHKWMQMLTDMGLEEKTKLATQPANSPDLNMNDLGFFNALQSMCCCTTPRNEVGLIEMVEQTHRDCPLNKIN
mgnify:CR=1 FL=1